MATKYDDEIKRKASLGISLTNPTAESQKLYDSYKSASTPKVTSAPSTSNVQISNGMLNEIQRKSSSGIPLTDYTPQKQELYNSYKNPAPSYIGYQADPVPSYIGYKADPMPEYNSKYQGNIDSVLDSLLNTPEFSYDHQTDPLYSQYKESYNREGDRALANAMGEASALTGGRPSSYAMTAGQQAQNYYNAQLNDKIPELQQLAYEMYNQELNNKRSNIGTMQGLEDMMYGQYRGTMSDYFNNRDFEYGQTQNENTWNWDTYTNNRDFEYGQTQAENNWNWNQFDSTRSYDRNVIENDRNYDYNLWNSQNNLAIDQRNFDRGILESDRGYDRDVLESDRGYNRGVFESDRTFDNSNYWKGQEYQLGLGDRTTDQSRWQAEYDLKKEAQDYQMSQESNKSNNTKAPGLSYDKYYSEAQKMIENNTDPAVVENWIYRLATTGAITSDEAYALTQDLRLY